MGRSARSSRSGSSIRASQKSRAETQNRKAEQNSRTLRQGRNLDVRPQQVFLLRPPGHVPPARDDGEPVGVGRQPERGEQAVGVVRQEREDLMQWGPPGRLA